MSSTSVRESPGNATVPQVRSDVQEVGQKLGLHYLRRGPVTRAVNVSNADFNVQKLMRVSSISMVDYYSVADHQFLLKTSKSAF